MTNKCSISSLALEEVGKLMYRFSCDDNSIPILENYIQSLSCPNLPLQICSPDEPCDNSPIIFNCNFNILGQSLSINNNILTFSIVQSNYVGGTAPYSYLWQFETDDFELTSPINQSGLVLSLKPKKDLSQLVSRVAITITDANGCTDTKVCWLNKGVLKCSTNFHPCPNPKGLVMYNPIVNCPVPHNLSLS